MSFWVFAAGRLRPRYVRATSAFHLTATKSQTRSVSHKARSGHSVSTCESHARQ
jgi:hypothetical protein